MTPTSQVGRDVDRVDGRAKVKGAARYAADARLERLAHAYLVPSTVGKGRVSSMSTDEAERAPGVVAVYTPFAPLRLEPPPPGPGELFAPLQDTAVRYRGQAIGMVVAESYEQARDAAALVGAVYAEERPRTSLADGLPGTSPPGGGIVEDAKLTVLAPGVDSIEDALRSSDVVVEGTFTQPVQNHAAMEPHATTAVWRDGRLTVYTSTQSLGLVASTTAAQLGVEPDRVRVVSRHVGGGFGGKASPTPDIVLCAAAARDLDRPVQLVLGREQVFTVGGHRAALTQTVRLGAARDGMLSAVSHVSAAASSASCAPFFTTPASATSAVLYATPNLAVDQRYVTLDVPPTAAMRAPDEAPGSYALETAMDELAVATGVDPVELRLRNHATETPGHRLPWSSKHLEECYRVGAARFRWERGVAPRRRVEGQWLVGAGMATAVYPAGRSSATVRVRFRVDGTAVVATGTTDLGTGARTVLAIVGADALGIPVRRVEAELGDSSLPAGAPAFGSVVTGSTAPAVQDAAAAAVAALVRHAVDDERSPFHGMDQAAVRYEDGRLTADGRSLGFGDLLAATGTQGVGATASAEPGDEASRYAFHSFGAHFCEVRVNRYTGEPRVTRFTTVVDAGRVVNAKAARSQLVGGVVFGIGHALLEGNPLERDGRMASGNLADYLVPVHADMPRFDVHWLDHPDTVYSPFGARGVGELGTVGSAAAVGNAVYDATGIRVRDLPITLDKLLG